MDRILRRCGPARVRIDKSKPRTHKHSALPPLAHTLKLQTESLITVLAMQLALFDQALFEKLVCATLNLLNLMKNLRPHW